MKPKLKPKTVLNWGSEWDQTLVPTFGRGGEFDRKARAHTTLVRRKGPNRAAAAK